MVAPFQQAVHRPYDVVAVTIGSSHVRCGGGNGARANCQVRSGGMQAAHILFIGLDASVHVDRERLSVQQQRCRAATATRREPQARRRPEPQREPVPVGGLRTLTAGGWRNCACERGGPRGCPGENLCPERSSSWMRPRSRAESTPDCRSKHAELIAFGSAITTRAVPTTSRRRHRPQRDTAGVARIRRVLPGIGMRIAPSC
jgi:hypothetical protein